MIERTYNIVMQTSIGDRAGIMDVQIRNGKVTGYMNLLKRSEPFEGSIDENGNCQIRGTLVTLTDRYPYTAAGQITPDSLTLTLKGERISFPVIGKQVPVKEAAAGCSEFVQEGSIEIDG